MESDRVVLESRLASLIGFDDGASDVFEHILEIEGSEDLLDYLAQLLGDDSTEVQNFVRDVGRFKRGEIVGYVGSSAKGSAEDASVTQPTTGVSSTQKATTNVVQTTSASDSIKNRSMKKQRDEQKRIEKQRREADETRKRKEKDDKEQMMREEEDRKMAEQLQNDENVAVEIIQEQSRADDNADNNAGLAQSLNRVGANPKAPKHGKAKAVCGCYGTQHKPLTNCLHCGRIACRQEGYGFCPFCGFDIEKVKVNAGGGKFDKALLHKERLLQYDREFARRTTVLDDQADYFDRESAAWLTEEERVGAQQRDDDLQREKHERKKPVLKIAF